MSAATLVSFRTPVLAWSVSVDDEARFQRISRTVLLASLIVCLALPWLPVTQPDRTAPQALPPRLAKLLLEKELPPPPPPAVYKPRAELPKAMADEDFNFFGENVEHLE